MVVRIAGEPMYLWRAVDDEGEILDMLVQRRRDKRAVLKLMRKLLRDSTERVSGQRLCGPPGSPAETGIFIPCYRLKLSLIARPKFPVSFLVCENMHDQKCRRFGHFCGVHPKHVAAKRPSSL